MKTFVEYLQDLGDDAQWILDEKKKGWIKNAINPSHKGWCTPLSNPKCTGHRKALAVRFHKGGDLHND